MSAGSQPPAAPLLHHLLDRAAGCWPDRPAVTCDGHSLTYRQLAGASHRAAGWLRDRGIRRGDRIMVSAPPCADMPALVYGASRVGAPFCILHEQVRGRQLGELLDDAEPSLLITSDRERAGLAEVHGVPAEPLPGASAGGRGIQSGDGGGSGEVLSVDPACLIYTSGSTSLPKAVVSTHAQMGFAVQAIQSVLGYAPDDIVYVQLPLSFDYGLYQLFLAAASGAQVWLAGPADGGPALLRSLRRSAATVLPAVPPMADGLVRMLRRSQTQQLALRMFTSTGAAILPETVRSLRSAVPGLRIHLMFGLTECKRATIMPADGDLDRPGSCGRALPGTEVFIIGDGGRRLPAGEVGEIVVRGANVMSGYWRRPGDSRRVFPCAEGLFPELRTGDYGWLDEAGYLYFAGRRDDIYKEKGYRVSAAEVETAARRVPGVLDAAVVPADGQSGAVLAVTGPLSAAEVLHGMTSQIEDFKIPRNCLRVNELPRNCNGKVDRKAIMLLARQAGNA